MRQWILNLALSLMLDSRKTSLREYLRIVKKRRRFIILPIVLRLLHCACSLKRITELPNFLKPAFRLC